MSDPTIALALAERELRERLGPETTIEIGAGDDPVGEGYRWNVDRARARVDGDGPRGALYGAFDLLGARGWRWPWVGEERQPDREPPGTAGAGVATSAEGASAGPALPGRCVALGHRVFLERGEAWVAWAARNRLNTIFVHTGAGRDPFAQAPEHLWRERAGAITALARERGMTIEHGGHLLPAMLDDDQTAQLAAELDPDAASGPGHEALRRAVARYASEHPDVDVVHLWGEDLPSGAMAADAPDTPTPAERTLQIANAVAGALDGTPLTRAQVAWLAYHDTDEVPRRVRPHPRVCPLWAPRERCYDHGLDDPSCRENAGFRERFAAIVEHFAAAGAAPPRVFEYYLDAVLFTPRVPDLASVIAGDLRFYAAAGAHTVQALATGPRGWHDPHPNAEAFARLAWDPDG